MMNQTLNTSLDQLIFGMFNYEDMGKLYEIIKLL